MRGLAVAGRVHSKLLSLKLKVFDMADLIEWLRSRKREIAETIRKHNGSDPGRQAALFRAYMVLKDLVSEIYIDYSDELSNVTALLIENLAELMITLAEILRLACCRRPCRSS